MIILTIIQQPLRYDQPFRILGICNSVIIAAKIPCFTNSEVCTSEVLWDPFEGEMPLELGTRAVFGFEVRDGYVVTKKGTVALKIQQILRATNICHIVEY